jgi:hypothetical protein
MAEWRADWEARFAALIADGLPARLTVELSPGWQDGEEGLWVVHIHPLADPALWAPREVDFAYHLSIAEEGVVTPEEAAALHAAFHGLETVVRFGERWGGYLTVVGALGEHPAVIAAHARGRYSDRDLHVSM